MKWTYPEYYSDFKCTAENCSDNCCIGWEIDIDDETLCRYREEQSEFRTRLNAEISLEGTPHFLLKGERCTFLNDRNLCDLILALGEDALCEICREHPRFHGWYGKAKETGVGLCCEEAAKLILQREAPDVFIRTEIEEEPLEELENEELFEALTKARNFMFALIQNRDYSIRQRLVAALRFAYNLQGALEDCFDDEDAGEQLSEFLDIYREHLDVFFGENEEKDLCAESLSQLLSYFLSLEVLDPNWPEELRAVQSDIEAAALSLSAFMSDYPRHAWEYEHLAVYFIYRYMLKAIYNCDVLYCVKLMVVSILLIAVLDTHLWKKNGEFTLEDQILIVKAFSKEIEYNQENLDQFREDSWTEEFLSTKSLLAFLV